MCMHETGLQKLVGNRNLSCNAHVTTTCTSASLTPSATRARLAIVVVVVGDGEGGMPGPLPASRCMFLLSLHVDHARLQLLQLLDVP